MLIAVFGSFNVVLIFHVVELQKNGSEFAFMYGNKHYPLNSKIQHNVVRSEMS